MIEVGMAKSTKRADQLVFEQGLAISLEQATRLIMAGKVFVLPSSSDTPDADSDDDPDADPGVAPLSRTSPPVPLVRVDKPGTRMLSSSIFVVNGLERFVSRGAYKLLTGLQHFSINPTGFVCLDAGASTGGFTDCLLQHGAQRVYAVDVGHNQLHEKLRADNRVISMEGTNLRTAAADCIPELVDILVADVSFISLTQVLPACMQWLRPGAQALVLIKPQFELGAHQTDRGVVRDPSLQQVAVDKVLSFCKQELDLLCLGTIPAAIKGPKGNQEFVACFRRA